MCWPNRNCPDSWPVFVCNLATPLRQPTWIARFITSDCIGYCIVVCIHVILMQDVNMAVHVLCTHWFFTACCNSMSSSPAWGCLWQRQLSASMSRGSVSLQIRATSFGRQVNITQPACPSSNGTVANSNYEILNPSLTTWLSTAYSVLLSVSGGTNPQAPTAGLEPVTSRWCADVLKSSDASLTTTSIANSVRYTAVTM